MQEIEVKFKVHDFSSVRPKLESLGARMIWKGMEENIFFDTRRKDLHKKNMLFRLRRWDNTAFLTVKTAPVNKSAKYKIKYEYQVEISDFSGTQKLIEVLGFTRDFSYKKYREHWKYKDAFIELDTVGQLHFVEIESSEKNIDAIAYTLGLDWKKAERRGYVKILKDTARKKKI